MGCPSGLKKASNYFNKLESWRDWSYAKKIAIYCHMHNEVIEFCPRVSDGVTKIDKATRRLIDAVERLYPGATNDHPFTKYQKCE
jgi:hypothetical protein